VLTPRLDSAARLLSRAHHFCWRATAPLQSFASWYTGLTGLGQRWRMFMNPPTYDEYLQARYYVGAGDSTRPQWVAMEVIYPTHREDTVRLFQSFRDSYTDKAIAIALADHLNIRQAKGATAGAGAADQPNALSPIARHFARRFAARHLLRDERVVRTELWRARPPNRRPGTAVEPQKLEARRAMLRRYYAGPVEDRRFLPGFPSDRAVQREGDLAWVMEYVAR